jgi:hypothetical protein
MSLLRQGQDACRGGLVCGNHNYIHKHVLNMNAEDAAYYLLTSEEK